jgi:V/A-type H+-transporting ATPase subunit I
VENPPAVRIIQPVFDFLGTVPNYREYDISSWFLIFFAIFFAMIFGDASYGTIIALFSLGSMIAARRKGKAVGDAQRLFLLLGITTILWGALTGTWFGIQFAHLPKLLQDISLPLINGQSPDSESNIKVICFSIGLVQLSIAHLKNIRRDFPDLKFLSQVGYLLLLAGMFNAALNLVIDAERFPIENWAILCIVGGFLLIFMFGNWNGKLGSSLIESLKGVIPTFLGTVSVFADIVSYIRLWAVGLAGLAFAQTVNGMAAGLLSGPLGLLIGFILKLMIAAVLLVVAHSLNFVLTVLSVIVHGIRLNMLEFSGHLGMEWSGYKYDPLREDEHLSASMKSTGIMEGV